MIQTKTLMGVDVAGKDVSAFDAVTGVIMSPFLVGRAIGTGIANLIGIGSDSGTSTDATGNDSGTYPPTGDTTPTIGPAAAGPRASSGGSGTTDYPDYPGGSTSTDTSSPSTLQWVVGSVVILAAAGGGYWLVRRRMRKGKR